MKKLILSLLALLVLGVAWYLLSPLVLNEEIDEAFPTPLDQEESIEQEASDMPQEVKEGEEMEDTEMNEDMPATEPFLLKEGDFMGADTFHQGSGTASIYTLEDNSQLLRFENFSVTNGPDLRVLLAVDGNPDQSVEIGKLKGNLGNQNYEIDTSIDVSAYNSVIIYCKPFHVTFSTASLE